MNIINVLTESAKPYEILLPLALILIVAKVLGILCKKVGIPSVVGYLLSGLLLGLITLIPGQFIFTSGAGGTLEGINFLAKIGVILIMFSAGLETDISKIKTTGKASIVVTCLGVLVPLGLGTLSAFLFFPSNNILVDLFYGVLLSATSVSITISVLREIGKLNTTIGACIESAAIIDDIIGIILLSLILSLGGTSTGSGLPFGLDTGNIALNILLIVVFMGTFFLLCIILYKPTSKLFTWLNNKWPHHRRIPVFGFCLAFLLAYCAEKVFGVADITGAFVAGLMLASSKSKDYIDHKVDSESGIIFGPIFFASIGLMLFTTPLSLDNSSVVIFGIVFILMGLLGKIIGCGGGALICGYKMRDSLKVGIGMMARAEVIIVCAQKGIDAKMVDPTIMIFVIILIIISSLLTPILLKLLYKKELDEEKKIIK